MTDNKMANVLIVGLAIVGAVVLAPWILVTVLGLSIGAVVLVLRLVTWMFAGAIAGRLLRGEGYGPFGDIALGIIGGIIGTVLFSVVGLGWMAESLLWGVLVGAVGAIVFVYLVRLIFNSNFAR